MRQTFRLRHILLAALCLGPMSATAGEDEAEAYIGRVIEHSRVENATPEDVRTSASFDGEEVIHGTPCYLFTVYADLPERYETLGFYAAAKDGSAVYVLDIIENEYRRISGP